METTVEFRITLPIKITKKKKWFVASCPILDVHSQGETETKARNNLKDALSLFFISCFERGTLDSVLKNSGFRAVHLSPIRRKQPSVIPQDHVNVPIPFLVSQMSDRECRA